MIAFFCTEILGQFMKCCHYLDIPDVANVDVVRFPPKMVSLVHPIQNTFHLDAYILNNLAKGKQRLTNLRYYVDWNTPSENHFQGNHQAFEFHKRDKLLTKIYEVKNYSQQFFSHMNIPSSSYISYT